LFLKGFIKSALNKNEANKLKTRLTRILLDGSVIGVIITVADSNDFAMPV
jgi:uncharacterized membrane protein